MSSAEHKESKSLCEDHLLIIIYGFTMSVESTKTKSMEDVSTGVFEKNKE